MSIPSVIDDLVSGRNNIPDKAEITVPEAQYAKKIKISELSQLTDGASLSTLVPRIQAVINEIAGSDDNVLDTLTANVSSLQDGFIDTLYSLLAQNDVDLSKKLTLRLDKNGSLTIAGEHPDTDTVENLLQSRPDLSAAFREIASQSELMRDIRNISKLIHRQAGQEQYARMAEDDGSATYRMSLKGDMSHFYFSRV